ncbi:ABC transporter ATP-binding protein [Dongia sp.]|jgi:ABC-type Fe3+/spermidine/putrescine transport system ATPase subunit|uniref:ABC transporter ATP-binding protein n=1 Tax=Dongia sp. TaxID=1977262 RepID=UPI0035B0E292
MSAVELKAIEKHFAGGVIAVDAIDLDVPDGAFVTLLGPSGCGKTTTLRMVAGLEHPTGGEIRIKGKRVNETPIHQRNLGMVFQNYALFPHKSIFDNVAFGLKYRGVVKADIETRVRRALDIVRLPGVEQRFPQQLSGGQQQRIALARALVIEPDVLLLDEPLSALDANLREEMRGEIKAIQQRIGVTAIFVTHDQGEALAMSDLVVVMNKGKIEQRGAPAEVYEHPRSAFVANFLGNANFVAGTVAAVDGKRVSVALADGARIDVADAARAVQLGEAVNVIVRAEKIDIGGGGLAGTIAAVDYLGSTARYDVILAGGQKVTALATIRDGARRVGEAVSLSIAAEHCRIL